MSSGRRAMSRRTFLAAGAGFAGAATLAACGGGSGKKPQTFTNDPVNGFGIAVATAQALSGVDQRIAVGLFEKGQPVTGDNEVRLSFAPDVLHTTFTAPQVARFHSDGIPTKPYFEVTQRFDRAGTWFVKAETTRGGKVTAAKFDVTDPARSPVPVPGAPMPKAATPTTTNAMGVNPICTRQPAFCPFHQLSLDVALASGKPTAALFATPALCESRTCGPVLEVLMSAAPAFAGKVQFVHVEVWTDLQAQKHVPAFDAYGLTFEPILFLADRSGVVRERLDGPYDTVEARAALTRLVA